MEEIVGGAVFVLTGIAQIILRKRFVYPKVGNHESPPVAHLGNKEINIFEAGIVLFSVALIITGAWSLSGSLGLR